MFLSGSVDPESAKLHTHNDLFYADRKKGMTVDLAFTFGSITAYYLAVYFRDVRVSTCAQTNQLLPAKVQYELI
jgi:hypothetical protein